MEKGRFKKLEYYAQGCQKGLVDANNKKKALEGENALLKNELRFVKEENLRLQTKVENLTVELCAAKEAPLKDTMSSAQKEKLREIAKLWGDSPKRSADDQKDSLGDVMMPLLRSFVPDCIFKAEPDPIPDLDLALPDLPPLSSPVPPLDKSQIPHPKSKLFEAQEPCTVDSKETPSPDSATPENSPPAAPWSGSYDQYAPSGFGWDALAKKPELIGLFPDHERSLDIIDRAENGDETGQKNVTTFLRGKLLAKPASPTKLAVIGTRPPSLLETCFGLTDQLLDSKRTIDPAPARRGETSEAATDGFGFAGPLATEAPRQPALELPEKN